MTQRRFIVNPGAGEAPRAADVVIVGGGPAGTGALWALGRAAPGIRIVLVEKSDRLAAGSSLASLENYRTSWPALCLARLMRRSVEVLHRADDTLGEGAAAALAMKEQGYLYCGFTAQQAAQLESDVRHLHDIGLRHVEFLDADEVAYRFPWLGGRVIAAKYDPVAGWLDSNALVYSFVRSVPSAVVLLGVDDAHIVVRGGRVRGVMTAAGMIAAPNVLIAAGAGSRAVGRSAGIDVPTLMRPRQSFTTAWRHEAFPEDAPMLIGAPPAPHVRPEARAGAIFGWEYRWNSKHAGDPPGATRDYLVEPVFPADSLKDPRFPSVTLALLARQFGHGEGGGFADGRYLRGLSHNIGYYVHRDHTTAYRVDEAGTRELYESERAILDAWPGIDGLFLSVAHVGHGIMSAPAAGEVIAAKILRQPLPEPIFAEFGLDCHRVEHDDNAL